MTPYITTPISSAASGKRIVIIGAGLGGLSCAIRLAAAGCRVTVIEAQPRPGGKLARIEQSGYRFDRGPSTITMPGAFASVFTAVGRRMEDYVTLYRLDPSTRNLFADGHKVDLCRDRERMKEQLAAFSPEDARQYDAFMDEAERLYRLSERHFLSRLLLSWRDKADPALLRAFLRVRPFTRLNQLLRRYFRHSHTLAMFGRYATYVGGSPTAAPAIFAMLAHVETEIGVYGVRGGTYELVQAFVRLAEELGVTIVCGARAKQIAVRNGRAHGVLTTAGDLPADEVVVGADLLTACRELLPPGCRQHMTDARIDAYEPSLSGFVILAGVPQTFPQLLHHTLLFPERYGEEFTDIFRHGRPASDPALYLCNSSFSDPEAAPAGGSNLFILANAPYLGSGASWTFGETLLYRDLLLERLERRGFGKLGQTAQTLEVYTPADLRRDTSAFRGAIYGISANTRRQTFFRPSNRSRDVQGLWFTGGTTHPGGGTPIVVLSGQRVAERLLEG
ncbi:phytoene desaturase [Paenibacillus athensensis]|uniref:4,4'-diaponeurosporene oxygenase n=1 Tax=Paenibacillus athensensis TaxID=1967502 RepID=A0A4Y8Q4A2_9BACL|nr:phytoene desaturase family protein [Paenibacillus athensensis]MCD1261024.1 phytoene desaturase [Paenibacillus athensensis]